MKTSINKLENSMVELTIEETKENIAKYRKKALEKIKKTADIKGFRKGANIPEEIIVKNFGEGYIQSVVVDEALNVLYVDALRVNGLLPVTQGEIKEIKSQDPLVIVMTIEVFPEVEITGDYKSVKLPKKEVSVEDAEVEQALSQIQSRFTKFEVAGEGYQAKLGDKVEITTQGFDLEGNKLENTNMEAYPIVLGSNLLVPGFEEGLVGKTANETVTLDITFPADYHNEAFKGKQTKFEVTLGTIETAVKPEFTPEFIKGLRGKDLDLDGFKALIKAEILETKEMNARIEDESKLIDELLKFTKVEYGPTLLKNHTEKVYAEIKQNISQNGAKPADYIASLGMTEEQYIEQNVTPVAIKRLQAELILHKLGEAEKIEATQEEIDAEIAKIMSKFESQDVLARLKDLYQPNTKYYAELQSRIMYRKLIDMFFTK